MFSDFEDDGPMWTGTGPRESRTRITFSEKFRNTPAVQVSISMWDLDNRTNLRADLSADNIDVEGFDIVFKTWADTRVARLRASWIAMGEARQSDDWELY